MLHTLDKTIQRMTQRPITKNLTEKTKPITTSADYKERPEVSSFPHFRLRPANGSVSYLLLVAAQWWVADCIQPRAPRVHRQNFSTEGIPSSAFWFKDKGDMKQKLALNCVSSGQKRAFRSNCAGQSRLLIHFLPAFVRRAIACQEADFCSSDFL